MTERKGHIEDALSRFLDSPEVRVETDGTVHARGRMREDFPGFQGHFPGMPVLAGAFQVEMLHLLATGIVPEGWELARIHHTRFRKVVKPGMSLDLEAAVTASDNGTRTVKGTLSVESAHACVSTLIYAPESDQSPS